MVNRNFKYLVVFLMLITFSCCAPEETITEEEELVIFTGIPPYQWLIQQIAGEKASVFSLIENNADPHTFEPTMQQMVRLNMARIYFNANIEFETKLLQKVSDSLETVSLVEGLQLRSSDHDYASHSEHEVEDDPHVWLSPLHLTKISQKIISILVQIDPKNAAYYQKNAEQLDDRILAMHESLKSTFAPHAGRTIFTYHPAFGYFTDCYQLKQKSFEMHGKQPSARQIRTFVEQAREAGNFVILVQPGIDQKGASLIAEATEGHLVEINPMAADVFDTLEKIKQALIKDFKQRERN